jgi:fused signal recognition particle receptor
MFDGLKKKLNRFREDVEETAEEKAEAAEAAEAESADEPEDPDADALDDPETESESDTATAPPEDAAQAPSEESAVTRSGEPAVEESPASADEDDTPAAAETESRTTTAASDPPATTGGGTEPDEPAAAPDAAGTDDVSTSADEDDATPTTEADATPTTEDDSTSPGEDQVTPTDASADDADDEAADRPGRAASNVEEALSEDVEESRSGPGRLKRAAAFATGKIIIEEEDLEDPLWELEMALLESDVELGVAEEMLQTIREKMIGETRAQVQSTGELVSEALHDALLEVISVGQFDFDQRIADADKPVTIIFTGVNGVGKTTSIAKMSEYFEDQGYSTVLANGDTYRAGANEQIREHAANLDRKLISHEQGGDPAAVIYDAVEYAKAHDVDVVLGDTAGRLHTSSDLMAQLEKIHRVVDPDMTLFVDEAVAGQDAVQRARKFNEAAEIDGAILTKADADSQGGAAISIAYVTGKPILFLGTGQGYDDLERFDPVWLVDQLLGEES